jgi:hydroxymethylbilane synthase
MPIGAFCHSTGDGDLSITSIVVSLDGSRAVRAQRRGSAGTPEQLGMQVADELLAKGADSILNDARRASATESHRP